MHKWLDPKTGRWRRNGQRQVHVVLSRPRRPVFRSRGTRSVTTIPETAEPDGTTRVEEAAEAVVASRRALTAAERRAKRLREEHQGLTRS